MLGTCVRGPHSVVWGVVGCVVGAPRRDDAGDHAGTGVCAAHVSSSGRQKRIEVRAMGWSLEGRRLATANNEGSVASWSGLDFSHLNTTQLHTDRDTGSGVPIHALAWLRDGASFVTGDAQVITTNIETPRFWIDPLRNWAAWARCILIRPTRVHGTLPQGTLHYIEWGGARLDTKDLCPAPGLGIAALAVAPTTVTPRPAHTRPQELRARAPSLNNTVGAARLDLIDKSSARDGRPSF